MPRDRRYGKAGTEFSGIPEDPKDSRFDLMVGLATLAQLEPTYQKAGVYYDGRVEEWHAHPRVREALEQSAQGYPFRFAAVPVDTLAERVRLTSIKIDEGAQETWNAIYDDNDMKSWSSYQHFQTFKHGDSYLRVWPASDDETENPRGLEVALTYLSPFNVTIIYDGVDSKVPQYAVHRWVKQEPEALKNPNNERFRADVYYHDRLVRWWTPKPGSDGKDYKDWEPYEAEGEPHDDPYNFEIEGLPIKHCRTSLVYGRPAHEAAYGPQNALMKHLVTELATVDTHGWPVRMLLADPSAALDSANDNPDWDEEDSGTEVPASTPGSVATSFREAPGIIQLLEGIKGVAEFKAGDTNVLIDPVVKMYLPMMAVTTRTPLYEFFGSMGEEASGKSKAAADGPINKKIDRLQTLLTDFWEEVVHAALSIVGTTTKAITVGWAPSKMVADKESWEAIGMMLQAGVDWAFVMKTVAGFDPVTVDTWDPPPTPREQQEMSMEHDLALAKTKGVSSDPAGRRGGANIKTNPMKRGTNPRAEQGQS